MLDIDDYNDIRECTYKNETYSVRDNGAVMRHQREGMRKRKLDDLWSFGTPNFATSYMDFCGERVHRIVATAFHGPAPTEQHVVDHIDTNRQNNRPENLRWLTKLENILNNEITRKKVELICGSIEAFLQNPSLLYGYETEDRNFSWMKNVTPEEAKACLENWSNWAKTATPNPNFKKSENPIGNWIFSSKQETRHTDTITNNSWNPKFKHPTNERFDNDYSEEIDTETISTKEWINHTFSEKKEEPKEEEFEWYESSTPSAKQSWWTKTEFPCCPEEVSEDGLEQYETNLQEGKPFSINYYDTYYVLYRKLVKNKNKLIILSHNHQGDGYVGTYALCIIKVDKGFYLHINFRRFGYKDDAIHFYKILIGEEQMTVEDEIYLDT